MDVWGMQVGCFDPLRPGILGGGEDEVQPLQGVDSLMTELFRPEQLD